MTGLKHDGGKYAGVTYRVGASATDGFWFECGQCGDIRDGYGSEDGAHDAAFDHIASFLSPRAREGAVHTRGAR